MKMKRSEQKLRKAGLGKYIDNGSLVVDTREVLVEVKDSDGDLDWDKTDRLAKRAMKALGWGGRKAAGGHWYLEKDMVSNDAALRDQLGLGAY